MPNFNMTQIIGHLTRDPEQRQVGGTSVTNFTIAVSEKYKTQSGEQREDTAFIDCESWGKQGDVIAQYVQKGHAIMVVGKLKQDNWEDKDGNKRSKLKVRVDTFVFMPRRDGGEPQRSSGRPQAEVGYGGSEDDIPF